jgi:hypothetical protein
VLSDVRPTAGRQHSARAAQTIDRRLIVTPRTLMQAAMAGGLRVTLTVSPVLPGPNHFELRLAERGRSVTGDRVHVVARMIGMAMQPISLAMREVQSGRYAATGPLTMFGRWRVNVQIERPGAAPLAHRFTVGVDLPRGLLATLDGGR